MSILLHVEEFNDNLKSGAGAYSATWRIRNRPVLKSSENAQYCNVDDRALLGNDSVKQQ
jgi:hypothetical protein